MTDREKLIKLLHSGVRCPGTVASCDDCQFRSSTTPCDEFAATADMLIANGVTFATDIIVGRKMTPTDKDTNVLTNADRIRAMTDEELIACFVLEDKCPPNISRRLCDGFESCKDCWIHWLNQPAEVTDEN